MIECFQDNLSYYDRVDKVRVHRLFFPKIGGFQFDIYLDRFVLAIFVVEGSISALKKITCRTNYQLDFELTFLALLGGVKPAIDTKSSLQVETELK